MSCPHATTTTLLWLYGEGDEDHLDHVAECAECQLVVAEHAEVASALGPVLPALATPPPVPTGRTWWLAPIGVVALAAATLLAVRALPPPVPSTADTDVAVVAPSAVLDDDLDEALEGLERDLSLLEQDLLTL